MQMLSEDDLDLRGMDDEELARAWDLWFDLMQATNDADPPYTHGVFAHLTREELGLAGAVRAGARLQDRAVNGGERARER